MSFVQGARVPEGDPDRHRRQDGPAIESAARKEMEALLGERVHLDLSVRVRKGWRRNDALLNRLGIE